MTFKEFKEKYETNLGRHSVNYHSWYTCDAETLDWLKNIYWGSKQFREDFKKKKTVEIVLKDYNTGKEETAKLTYNMGNIEEVIPFNMYPHPWVKMSWDMGYLGFPASNKLLLD